MNCSQAQQCLQDRLDGLPAALPADLAAHLAGCADCQQLHAAAGRLLTGLRRLKTPAPPRELHARVVAEVLADRDERLSFRRRLTAVCAVAAGLILAVATVFPFLQRPSTTPSLVVTPPRPAPVVQAPKPSLRGSFTQAGFAFASLTRRTADETVGQSRLLLPETVPAPLPVPENVPTIDGTTSVWAGASQGMSTGLEPITNSARRAFSMLLREGSDEKR